MRIQIKQLENKLGFKIKRNSYVLGVDIASTTGLSILETNNKTLSISTFIFRIPILNKDDEKSEKYIEKLEFMLKFIREFKLKIKPKKNSILVLENSYLGFNSYSFGQLKAMCGICFSELYDSFETIKIVFAITARKEVGFKSQLKRDTKKVEKKKEIIDWINNIFNTKETDDNITDSLLLSLYGLKDE